MKTFCIKKVKQNSLEIFFNFHLYCTHKSKKNLINQTILHIWRSAFRSQQL